ncbi:MAG: deoxynucleoside kinase [Schwartzia sp.]|nr:deoxynucleoside kinase [Schwartzia sp. (in: firmicutes)]
MKGKLIVIEAGDASGKATQTKILCDHLKEDGKDVRHISFPDYESNSSALVKMYLSGEFGKAAGNVNAYAASSFFAVDRYASYKLDWERFYKNGGIVICDRYTTSNLVHQAVKIDSSIERAHFRDWLMDYEYEKLGLPRPDCVIFLDMSPDVSDRLLEIRNAQAKDIHEHDRSYLHACHAMYQEVAALYGWHRISCSSGMRPRQIKDIAKDVYDEVVRYLN